MLTARPAAGSRHAASRDTAAGLGGEVAYRSPVEARAPAGDSAAGGGDQFAVGDAGGASEGSRGPVGARVPAVGDAIGAVVRSELARLRKATRMQNDGDATVVGSSAESMAAGI